MAQSRRMMLKASIALSFATPAAAAPPAGDADPASSVPRQGVRGMQWGCDPLDGEPGDDAEQDGPAVFGSARCCPVWLVRAA